MDQLLHILSIIFAPFKSLFGLNWVNDVADDHLVHGQRNALLFLATPLNQESRLFCVLSTPHNLAVVIVLQMTD